MSLPRWQSVLSTLGPVGRVPRGGGTLAAVVALPVILWLRPIGFHWRLIVALSLGVASLWIIAQYVAESAKKDPQEVVLDEFVGCLVAGLFAPPGAYWTLSAFALFRLFDIAKPWPIGWIDRRVGGGWGVLLDDIAAAIAAIAVLDGLCALMRAIG